MIDLLVYLAIFVILVVVVWFLLTQMTLPEPLNKIILIAVVVIGAVFVIMLLLSMTGGGSFSLPHLRG